MGSEMCIRDSASPPAEAAGARRTDAVYSHFPPPPRCCCLIRSRLLTGHSKLGRTAAESATLKGLSSNRGSMSGVLCRRDTPLAQCGRLRVFRRRAGVARALRPTRPSDGEIPRSLQIKTYIPAPAGASAASGAAYASNLSYEVLQLAEPLRTSFCIFTLNSFKIKLREISVSRVMSPTALL